MAGKTLSRLSILFLLAFHHICFAHQSGTSFQGPAVKIGYPSFRMEAEAGVTEFWDNQVFSSIGGTKAIRRITVQPKGLGLPYYSDFARVGYVVEGSGVVGILLPWCVNKCDWNVTRMKAGDVFAVPAGVALWYFNDGDQPTTIISVSTTGNNDDDHSVSGDNSFKNEFYYLAGNPLPTNTEVLAKMTSGGNPEIISNIINGFDENLLAESFNIDTQIIDSLQGQNDQRGNIVHAIGIDEFIWRAQTWLSVDVDEQQTNVRFDEFFGEDLCTMKFNENILDHPDSNSSRGFIMTIDKKTLPILGTMHISVQKGVHYQNVNSGPEWYVNAHSITYVTRGSGRVEIVDNRGKSVFDVEVKTCQILVVPKNFVALTKASEQGLEWISFQMNDYSIISQLARVLKDMPLEVVMNSYQISREDAIKVKSIS